MGNTAALLKPQGALETLNRVRIIENVRNKLVASLLGRRCILLFYKIVFYAREALGTHFEIMCYEELTRRWANTNLR